VCTGRAQTMSSARITGVFSCSGRGCTRIDPKVVGCSWRIVEKLLRKSKEVGGGSSRFWSFSGFSETVKRPSLMDANVLSLVAGENRKEPSPPGEVGVIGEDSKASLDPG